MSLTAAQQMETRKAGYAALARPTICTLDERLESGRRSVFETVAAAACCRNKGRLTGTGRPAHPVRV